MKKWFALLLAVIMVATMMPMAMAEEPMTIHWTYTDENPPIENDWLRDLVEETFNVKIEPVVASDTERYTEFYSLEWAAGKSYDFYFANGTWMRHMKSMVDQGLIMPLDKEMIKANMPNFCKWVEEYGYGEEIFDFFSIDGQLYSIPVGRADNTYRMVAGIRGDWLEEVGLEVPTTLEEWEEVMEAFTYGDPDGNGIDDTYGYTGVNWDIYTTSIFTNVFGCLMDAWYVKDGQIVYGNVQPEMKDALALMNKWYQAGYFAPGVFTNDWDQFRNDMITEKAGVALQSYYCFAGTYDLWMIGDLAKVNPDAYYELSPGIVGEDGKYGILQFSPFSESGICFDYKMADQPEKLAKYMQIIDTIGFSKEWSAMARWGKKDVDWTIDETGAYIRLTDDESENITPTGDFIVETDTNFYDPIMLADFEQQDQISKDLQASVVAMANPDVLYDLAGLITQARPMNDQYGSALSELRTAYFIPIITGERPLDDFDQFVTEWYASGGTEVEAETRELLKNLVK